MSFVELRTIFFFNNHFLFCSWKYLFRYIFRSIYREHLEAFLDAILSLEFNTVESLWREFWRSQYNNNGDECEEEKYLSKYVKCLFYFFSAIYFPHFITRS